MNHNHCYFHKNNRILKFCTLKQCTLPLCQQCEPIHLDQHSKNNTRPQIISFLSAHSRAVSQLQTLLNDSKDIKDHTINRLTTQKDQLLQIVQQYYDRRLQQVSQAFKDHTEIETKLKKIKKNSLKTLILFYSEGVQVKNPPPENNFNTRQSELRVSQFKEFFKKIQEGNLVQEIIMPKQSSERNLTGHFRIPDGNPKPEHQINLQRIQGQAQQYDQRVYSQIKDEVFKERRAIFDRQSNNDLRPNHYKSPQVNDLQTCQTHNRRKTSQPNKYPGNCEDPPAESLRKVQKQELSRIRNRYQGQISGSQQLQRQNAVVRAPLGSRYEFGNKQNQPKSVDLNGRHFTEEKSNFSYNFQQKLAHQNSKSPNLKQYTPYSHLQIEKNNQGDFNRLQRVQKNTETSSKKQQLGSAMRNKERVTLIDHQFEQHEKKIDALPSDFKSRFENEGHHQQSSNTRKSVFLVPKSSQTHPKVFTLSELENSDHEKYHYKYDQMALADQKPHPNQKPSKLNFHHSTGTNQTYTVKSQTTAFSGEAKHQKTIGKECVRKEAQKFDYEKLSKEVLAPQQIRRMLQRRIEQRNRLVSNGPLKIPDPKSEQKFSPATPPSNRLNIGGEDTHHFVGSRRSLDARDSIIHQIYPENRY